MTRRPATVTHPQDGLELSNTGTHHSSAPQEKTLVLAAQVAPLFGVPSSTSRTENGQNTAVATRKRKYKKRTFAQFLFCTSKCLYLLKLLHIAFTVEAV